MTRNDIKDRILWCEKELNQLKSIEATCNVCMHMTNDYCRIFKTAVPADVINTDTGCTHWYWDDVPF